MSGTKASYLARFCATSGQEFVAFNYSGHGQSGGEFIAGTIGGWIALARELGAQLVGLIGIAAAPDFTENQIKPALTAVQQTELARTGRTELANPYGALIPISHALLEEGRW